MTGGAKRRRSRRASKAGSKKSRRSRRASRKASKKGSRKSRRSRRASRKASKSGSKKSRRSRRRSRRMTGGSNCGNKPGSSCSAKPGSSCGTHGAKRRRSRKGSKKPQKDAHAEHQNQQQVLLKL